MDSSLTSTSDPILQRRKSSSNSSLTFPKNFSTNKNLKQWTSLFNGILELNEKNYTKNGKSIIMRLQNIIQMDVMNSEKTCTTAILYILYERSVQELLLKSFPVSASLIDSLTSGSSEDIFNTVQPIIQDHLQRIQTKLRNSATLTGTDVGVICLLINMHRLDQMAGRVSPVTSIMEQIIKDTNDYIELISLEKNFSNDALVILLFSLIWYALNGNGLEINSLKSIIRKGHIRYHRNMSLLGRVLALDILEHIQDFKSNVKLYITNYKKIIHTQTYLLSGVEEYLHGTPFPLASRCGSVESLNESMTLLKTQKSIEQDDVFSLDSSPTLTGKSKSSHRLEPEGSSGSDEDLKSEFRRPTLSSSSSLSSVEEADAKDGKWARKVSQESKVNSITEEKNKSEELIRIPERYVGRIIGHEGAIGRKIELKSNATVIISKKDEPTRPETTPLTAHRLITGALGMRSQMAKDIVHEEKQKLQDAKVKRNADKPGVWTREIKLYGSDAQIDKAKTMINQIINNIITVSIPLKFTVDDLVHHHGNKMKTIEALLNVYIEIDEQEDLTAVLDISGDKKSCSDARKLIFEDICQFKTQFGQMFSIPIEMESIMTSDMDLLFLFGTVKDICDVNINRVMAPGGPAIFVAGKFANVSRAVDIFQGANFELTYALAQKEDKISCKDLCNFIQEKYGRRREVRRQLSKSPTLLKSHDAILISSDDEEEDSSSDVKKERIVHTRQHLIDIARSSKPHVFPVLLREFLLGDQDASQVIIEKVSEKKIEEILQSLR